MGPFVLLVSTFGLALRKDRSSKPETGEQTWGKFLSNGFLLLSYESWTKEAVDIEKYSE